MIEVWIQFFSVWILSGKIANLIDIETIYTFSWMTPIAILIFLAFMIIRYANFYKNNKSSNWKVIIKALAITIIADFKRFALWILFFYEENWLLLIFIPIILQILSLIVFAMWNEIKDKTNKVVWITNEVFALAFWVWCIFNYPCNKLYSEMGVKVVGMLMESFLIILLVVEWIIIWIQDLYFIRK